MLTLPLLNTNLADDELAAWIDKNTMKCHKYLLERLHTVRIAVS